jgi:hypothetical protein
MLPRRRTQAAPKTVGPVSQVEPLLGQFQEAALSHMLDARLASSIELAALARYSVCFVIFELGVQFPQPRQKTES